jgi:ubiquinone/menaquinone biosynthesis C-methylase UbiE
MSNPIAMGAQLAASAARFSWFYGINRMLDRDARRLGRHSAYEPQRPVPARQELMVELANLFLADAEAVRAGLFPPLAAEPSSLIDHLGRVRAMFADLPDALARRAAADAASVKAEPGADAVPDYYAQDFHFQSGGYLSEQSARLYDVQVETLFYGAADAMRRAALGPIAREIAGRDQRRLCLLDVACGTGRFLRQVRLAWPALELTGLDLSAAYLREAARHLEPLRPVEWVEGNAEAIPLPDASQDIVTSIFLFHELPSEVRRHVAAEMARVLRPGGLLVFVDSLQMGDRPGWDGLLEAFPVRFHEPYFRHYASDDLDALFSEAGLEAQTQSLAFLSKVMVRRKVR